MAAKSSLSEYLKKYTSDENPKSKLQKKKKKKAKRKSCVNAGGVRIVDEDATWQAEIKGDSSQEDSPDDGPQVIEDVEVKRMKRWEELKAQRPYFSVDEDGSGWVTVTDPKKPGLNSNVLSSKEEGNTDSSNDENMHSAPLDGSPNKDHANVVQKDLQVANEQTNYEDGKFFSDAEDHESHHLLQTRVCHNSHDVSPPASTRSADLSPPRKHLEDAGSLYPLPKMHARHNSPNLSPPRKAQTKSSDLSSPQMKVGHVSPDLSPPRKVRTKSPDFSPPRKRLKDVAFLDPLAQTKVRHDSPDLSPPRKGRTRSVDLSPPRKHQKKIGSSNPLQHKTVRHVSPDLSPPRKSQSPDLSPPRKRQKDILSSNSLLQRKDRHDSPDLSPPRKHKDVLSDEKDRSYRKHRENSPIQRHSHVKFSQIEDRGSSPARTHYNYSGRADDSPTRKRIIPSTRIADQTLSEGHAMDRAKGMEKMKDGTSVGLRTKEDLKQEIDRKKKEEIKRFSKMDASLSGRGAETVYRDKRGKRLGVEELMQLQKGQPKLEDKPLEWGKGLAQKREAEARQAELELEKNKPFARTRDDPELDKMLKERVRWGDPMAHLIKRKNVESVLENLDEDEKMKESGFIVPQDIPSHSWLKRRVDPPPNRYGIRPGRHWDGVDRSNGFEKESFKRQNEKRATETEAYLWSVADM